MTENSNTTPATDPQPNDGRKIVEKHKGVLLTSTYLNERMFFVEYGGITRATIYKRPLQNNWILKFTGREPIENAFRARAFYEAADEILAEQAELLA